MNARLKLGAVVIALLTSMNSYAWPFSSKLTYYKCPTEPAANACDSNCREIDGGKIEFKVNVKQKLVLYAAYKNSSQVSSGYYEHCKIFDKDNWVCGDESPNGILEQKMSNGIFTSSGRMYPVNPKGKLELSYSCAK
jgi:hypothetical protein